MAGRQRTFPGHYDTLGREQPFLLEMLLCNCDGSLHRGAECAHSILLSTVALALGDRDADLVGVLLLALVLVDAHPFARLAGMVAQLEAVAHLNRLVAVLLLLVLHT